MGSKNFSIFRFYFVGFSDSEAISPNLTNLLDIQIFIPWLSRASIDISKINNFLFQQLLWFLFHCHQYIYDSIASFTPRTDEYASLNDSFEAPVSRILVVDNNNSFLRTNAVILSAFIFITRVFVCPWRWAYSLLHDFNLEDNELFEFLFNFTVVSPMIFYCGILFIEEHVKINHFSPLWHDNSANYDVEEELLKDSFKSCSISQNLCGQNSYLLPTDTAIFACLVLP